MSSPRLHHVYVNYPEGSEAEARAFYSGLLGLPETGFHRPATSPSGRPRALWFDAGDGRQIHLGHGPDSMVPRSDHLALVVDNYRELLEILRSSGAPIEKHGEGTLDRCYVRDPFGNRIELVSSSLMELFG